MVLLTVLIVFMGFPHRINWFTYEEATAGSPVSSQMTLFPFTQFATIGRSYNTPFATIGRSYSQFVAPACILVFYYVLNRLIFVSVAR